jgi:hypothetical protein
MLSCGCLLVADLEVGFGFWSSGDGFGLYFVFRVCLLAVDLMTQWVFFDGVVVVVGDAEEVI